MGSSRIVRLGLVLVCLASIARPTHAEWPENGRAVYPIGDFSYPDLCHDGADGAIVVWDDEDRGGIYAHHVLGNGELDESWPVEGLVVCAAPGDQLLPWIVSDDSGGAWVAWTDCRAEGVSDVYVHHILPNGTVDPAWPADGFGLVTAGYYQHVVDLIPDGAGGAIVSWFYMDVGHYVQRVLAGAVVAWPDLGVKVSETGSFICTDGSGGVLSGFDRQGDLYVHHVLSTGVFDPTWPIDGAPVSTAAGHQFWPEIASDGYGGAVLAWQDSRGGGQDWDIYAGRVLATGQTDPDWPLDGRQVCSGTDRKQLCEIVSDDASGAFVVWEDKRSGTDRYDIYAHHIFADGVTNPTWPDQGMPLCIQPDHQVETVVAKDGAGGFYAMWRDLRNPVMYEDDIVGQHVFADGQVEWPVDGLFVCSAPGFQGVPQLIVNGQGRALVAWYDGRPSAEGVYVQRVPWDEPTSVTGNSPGPTDLSLVVSPNPTRGSVSIQYRIDRSEASRLSIVDASGAIVRTLIPPLATGAQSVVWTGRDQRGTPLPSGVYFVRLQTESGDATSRILLVR